MAASESVSLPRTEERGSLRLRLLQRRSSPRLALSSSSGCSRGRGCPLAADTWQAAARSRVATSPTQSQPESAWPHLPSLSPPLSPGGRRDRSPAFRAASRPGPRIGRGRHASHGGVSVSVLRRPCRARTGLDAGNGKSPSFCAVVGASANQSCERWVGQQWVGTQRETEERPQTGQRKASAGRRQDKSCPAPAPAPAFPVFSFGFASPCRCRCRAWWELLGRSRRRGSATLHRERQRPSQATGVAVALAEHYSGSDRARATREGGHPEEERSRAGGFRERNHGRGELAHARPAP
jgi:hypothetical protein